MLFLDLPSELLQMILLCSSTPSFVQLIRTCHTMFDLAARSRNVVLHHLENVSTASRTSSIDEISTHNLFLIFRRRAAASLQGVNISADRLDFYFSGTSVDVSASCITSFNCFNVALVRKGGSPVQIYEVFEGKVKLRGVLYSQSDEDTMFRPVKTAFDQMNNVHVLYSVIRPAYLDPTHLEPATGACLMRARLSALSRPPESWDITTKIGLKSLKSADSVRPIDMAVHGEDRVTVLLECDCFVYDRKFMCIELYTLFKDGLSHVVYLNDSPDRGEAARSRTNRQPEHYSCSTSRIAFFNGGKGLKCYSPSTAAPTYRISPLTKKESESFSVNKIPIPVGDDTGFFFLEDPFFAHHEKVTDLKHRYIRSCDNIRLSLATVTLDGQSQTIACILKLCKTLPEDDCPHSINLDETQALVAGSDVWIVARLWGFKLPMTTMATVKAFAQQGTRIAIASWDEISVWALRPKALAALRGQWVRGEWISHPTYKDRTFDSLLNCELVELRPIILKAGAVVHKMAFTANENELITITDKGLQVWNLGPSAAGRRTVSLLPDEEDV